MRYLLPAILAIALLGMTACGPAQPQTPDMSRPFIGGIGGLAASFPEGMPPVEIYDAGQMEFSVGVMLQNIGEHPIGASDFPSEVPGRYGYVELIGASPRHLNKLTQNDLRVFFDEGPGVRLEKTYRAADGSIIPGDISLVEFSHLSYLPNIVGNQEITLRANLCYDYTTKANSQLCFKDNMLESVHDDTICTLTGKKPLATSAAPVQVTQVTQNPAGRNRISVTFQVQNMGNGFVFAPSDVQNLAPRGDACVYTVGHNPFRNMVYVTLSMGSDDIDGGFSSVTDIRCPVLSGSTFGNRGILRLQQGGPATVTCTIETREDAGRVFTDTLRIDLHYSYLQYIETPILIRDTQAGFG
jgi:hypothetical protein